MKNIVAAGALLLFMSVSGTSSLVSDPAHSRTATTHVSRRTLRNTVSREAWEKVPFTGYKGRLRRLQIGK